MSTDAYDPTLDTVAVTLAPVTASTVADDESNPTLDLVAKILTNLLLYLLIAGLSATVESRRLKSQLTNKFALGTGVCMQFVVMPLLGFLAVTALRSSGLSEVMGLTLLVVTTSPGGSYSNWFCALFNAELALSVAMTAVSTIMSIAMLPANLMLYSHLAYGRNDEQADSIVGALDFGALFITLGVVVAAIPTGLFASYKWDSEAFRTWANRVSNVSGISLILVSFFLSSGGGGGDAGFFDHPWTVYVGVAMPCLLGIVLASLVSRFLGLSPPESMTIAIECCYQNPGIATSVAITLFDDPDDRAAAVAVPLFYGGLQAFVIFVYCLMGWKLGWSKAPRTDTFCTIVSNNYQISPEDDEDGQQLDDIEEGDRSQERPAPDDLARIEEESDEEVMDEERDGSSWSSWFLSPFRRRRRRTPAPLEQELELEEKHDEKPEAPVQTFAEDTNDPFRTPNKKIQPSRDRLLSEDTQATMVLSTPSTPTVLEEVVEINKFGSLGDLDASHP